MRQKAAQPQFYIVKMNYNPSALVGALQKGIPKTAFAPQMR